MNVKYSDKYLKNYSKLQAWQRLKVDEAIMKFIQNPFDASLKNHKLHGILKSKRAISAGNNLRIIFEERQNYTIVIFLQTGTHNQVYK